MTNQELYDAALKAITDLFSDMSVPKMVAKDNLRALRDEIDTMLDAMTD